MPPLTALPCPVRSLVALVLTLAAAAACGGCRPRAAPPVPVKMAAFVPPLFDAQIGETLVTRRGTQEWHYTVVSAGDVEVVVEVVVYDGGVPQGRGPQRFAWHRNNFGLPDNAVVERVEPARVDVGGTTWDCWLVHVTTRTSGRYYYWISDDVGVNGILKIAQSEGGVPDEAYAITWQSDSLSGRSLSD